MVVPREQAMGLSILYMPVSILGLLVGVGLFFILLGGLSMFINKEISEFFKEKGNWILFIGIIGWLIFIIPTIIARWSSLFK